MEIHLEEIKEIKTVQDEKISELNKNFKKMLKEMQENYNQYVGEIKLLCRKSGVSNMSVHSFDIDKKHGKS